MAMLAFRGYIASPGLVAAACCFALLSAPSRATAEQVSRFLELEKEIPVSDFGVKLDVAATPEGGVFVSSESRGGIWTLAQDGSTWMPLPERESGRDLPRHPVSIAVDGAGRLWIADSDRHSVVVVDSLGQPVHTYQDGGRSLRKPTRLSLSDENHMAVWNAERGALILLSMDPPSVSGSGPVADCAYCISANPIASYCVRTDGKTLVRYEGDRGVNTWTLSGQYARVGDLVVATNGDVYVTDTSGRRIYSVAADLKSPIRFRFYESLLQTPTRLAVAGDHLWLIDEGRQSLMRFRLRKAESAWEHALLGEEYLALSMHDAALEEFERAASLGLHHPDLSLHTGIALYGLGRYDDALAAWERPVQVPERQPVVWFWRGNALFRLGRYEEAVESYAAVERGDADYRLARSNLAQVYLALGDLEPARIELVQLLTLQPDNDVFRVSLARALIGLNEHSEAEALLVAVGGEGPAAGAATYHLGHLKLLTGDVRAALPLLERAARQGPYFRAALGDLVKVHRKLGDLEKANLYRQRLESLQDSADAFDAFILENES